MPKQPGHCSVTAFLSTAYPISYPEDSAGLLMKQIDSTLITNLNTGLRLAEQITLMKNHKDDVFRQLQELQKIDQYLQVKIARMEEELKEQTAKIA